MTPSVVESVAGRDAESVSSALSVMLRHCAEMKESEEMCRRLHHRLTHVRAERAKLDKTPQSPSSADSLPAYSDLVRKSVAFVRRSAGRPLYVRVIHHEAFMNELRALHEELDSIAVTLGVTISSTWKQQWEDDRGTMDAAMEIAIGSGDRALLEIEDARAQGEAMTVLKYEIAKVSKHSVAAIHLMKKLYVEIWHVTGADDVTVPTWFLSPEDIEFSDTPFARGSFGALHRGSWKNGTQRVVVKTLFIEDSSSLARQPLVNELDLWFTLDHPHVLRIVGACHVSSPPFVVYEDTASFVNMASFLSAAKSNKRHLWRLLREAALGLDYLHKHDVVHGHLMLANVLVGADGKARLSDFGLTAMRASVTAQHASTSASRLRWRAPECIKRRPVAASDIYSLAMCVIEAVTEQAPFAFVEDDTVYRLVRDGDIPAQPDQLDDETWRMIEGMTRRELTERTPLADVVAALELLSGGGSSSNGDVTDETSTGLLLLMALREGGQDEKKDVSAKLYRACDSSLVCEAIERADGVGVLERVALDHREDLTTRLYASGCVRRLQFNSASSTNERAASQANLHVNVRRSVAAAMAQPILKSVGADEDVVDALEKVACVLWSTIEAPDECVADDLLPRVVGLLGSKSVAVSTAACFVVAARSVCTSLSSSSAVVPALLQALEELVTNGEACQQLGAIFALGQLFGKDSNVSEDITLRASTVHAVVSLLLNGSDEQKLKTLDAVYHLAWTSSARSLLEGAGAVAALVKILPAGTDLQICKALEALSAMARRSNRSQDAIAKVGGVKRFLSLLRDGTKAQRHRAAAALGWIALREHEAIETADGIPLLVAFVCDTAQDERVAGVFALHRLAKYSTKSRELIHAAEGVDAVVAFLGACDAPSDKATAVEALVALSQYAPNCTAMQKVGVAALLVELLQDANQEAHKETIEALLKTLARTPFDVDSVSDKTAPTVLAKFVGSQDDVVGDASTVVLPLLAVLREGGRDEKKVASAKMYRACDASAACAAIEGADGVALLESLAKQREEDMTTRLFASGSLWRLTFNANSGLSDRASKASIQINVDAVTTVAIATPLLTSVGSDEDVIDALEKAACALWTTYNCPDDYIGKGFIATIVKLLGSKNAAVSAAACCVIGTRSVCHNLSSSRAVIPSILQTLQVLVVHGNVRQQLAAVFALGQLSGHHSEIRDDVVLRADTIESIMSLLRDGTHDAKLKTADAVQYLTWWWSATARSQLEAAGAMELLVDLLRTGSDLQICKALDALSQMPQGNHRIAKAGGIGLMMAILRDGTKAQKHRVASMLGRIAVSQHDAIEAANGIPLLLTLVRDKAQDERVAGVAALKELATYSAKSRVLVHEADGIRMLVDFLRTGGTPSDKAMAVKALTALSEYAPNCESMDNAGAATLLTSLLQEEVDENVKTKVSELLAKLPRDDEPLEATSDKKLCAPDNRVETGGDSHGDVGEDTSGIASLLGILRDSGNDARQAAIAQLYRVCDSSAACEAVERADGAALLERLSRQSEEDMTTRVFARGCIQRLYFNAASVSLKQATAVNLQINVARSLVAILSKPLVPPAVSDDNDIIDALEAMACVLWTTYNAPDEYVWEGFLSRVVTLLGSKNAALSAAACYVIGTRSVCHNLSSSHDVVPTILEILEELVANGDVCQQLAAVFALGQLMGRESKVHEDVMLRADTIQSIVLLLRSGTHDQKVKVADAVRHLTWWASAEVRGLLEEAGVIESLVDLLRTGSDLQICKALDGLLEMTRGNDRIANAGGIERMLTLLQTGTNGQKYRVAKLLERMAVKQKDAIAAAGAIPLLLAFVSDASQDDRVAGVVTLNELATRSPKTRVLVHEADGVGTLVNYLRTCVTRSDRDAVVTALITVSQYPPNCTALQNAGAVKLLSELLQGASSDVDKPKVRTLLKSLPSLPDQETTRTSETKTNQPAAPSSDKTPQSNGSASAPTSPVRVHETDSIDSLVEALRTCSTSAAIIKALDPLIRLSQDTADCIAMHKAGVVPLLATLLQTPPRGCAVDKQSVGALLGKLACHADAYPGDIRWDPSAASTTSSSHQADGSSGSPNSVQRIERLVEELSYGDPVLTDARLRALDRSVRLRASHAALVHAGGIDVLIEFIDSGTDDQKETAARIVLCVVSDNANCEAIKKAGGVAALAKLLLVGTTAQKEIAVHVLLQLASDHDVCLELSNASAINGLIQFCRLESPAADDATELLTGIASTSWSRTLGRPLATALVHEARHGTGQLATYAADVLLEVARMQRCPTATLASFIKVLVAAFLSATTVTEKQAAVASMHRVADSKRAVEAIAATDALKVLAAWASDTKHLVAPAATDALEAMASSVELSEHLPIEVLVGLASEYSWARVVLRASRLPASSHEPTREFACGLSHVADYLAVKPLSDVQALERCVVRAWMWFSTGEADGVRSAVRDVVHELVQLPTWGHDESALLQELASYVCFDPLLLATGAVAKLASHVLPTQDDETDALDALAVLVTRSDEARVVVLQTDPCLDTLVAIVVDQTNGASAAGAALVSLATNTDGLRALEAHDQGLDALEVVARDGTLDERVTARRLLRSCGRVTTLPPTSRVRTDSHASDRNGSEEGDIG